MRIYLRKLLYIGSLLILLLFIVGFIRMRIIQSHSWVLPKQVHVLFMGASHLNHAIDDSMMKTAINWTRGSERYMYTYIKLQHLIPVNPQIDTIFLELAPTDLWEDTDYKYHVLNEQSGYVKTYWPFYKKEHWEIVLEEPVQVAGLVLGSLLDIGDLQQEKWWHHLGNYFHAEGEMDRKEVRPALEVSSGHGHEVNYYYLRQIIALCKEKGIKLMFLETPTFHPEYFYDQDYFYRAYKENFSEIEFYDYSKWPMSDSERWDAHHLNHQGAKRFTKEIMSRFHIQ